MYNLSMTSLSRKLRCHAVTLTALFLTLAGGVAMSGGNVAVEHEQVVNAKAASVWESAGDFSAIHSWHPAIDATELNGDGKTAGDTRILTLGDGAKINETLVAWDADNMSLSYAITESPLPIKDYESTLSVQDNGDGSATVVWKSTFNSNGVSDEESAAIIKGIYEAGLTSLAEGY